MANHLKMAAIRAIEHLLSLGKSRRWIARHLGIDRETVARYARQADPAKPAISTPGSFPGTSPKPAISTLGKMGRKSACGAFQEAIAQKLESGLSAQRIYQDLREHDDFSGSYQSVKRFVRHLKETTPERLFRLECHPAEEAQVDFGAGAWILGADGKRKRNWVFRIALSFSRKAYSEAVYRQTTESFIRCLENAFRTFGGVPRSLSIDNLKAAVTRADWYDPELHPKIEEFCRHYGTFVLPTKPYHPQHKGKVESAIKYVKNNALKGRTFASLGQENEFLVHWEKNVADCRIHGTTRRQVQELFLEQEKSALLALPPMLFASYQEGRRSVHRDSYVEVQGAYYEVPQEYIGRKVWVRWDGRTVRIFNHRSEQLRVHARLERGKFSTCLQAQGRKGSVEHSRAYWLGRVQELGEPCAAWGQVVVQQRGPAAIRVLIGLLSLTHKHSIKAVNQACALALKHGTYRLRDLRQLIAKPTSQTNFSFLESHPLIRPLSHYDNFLKGDNSCATP